MNENMPRSGDASGGSTKQQIKDKASDLAQGAKEQARAQFDDRKGAAVGELGTLATSLRRVVDELGESNPHNMSGKVVSTIADRIDTFGRSLEGKDLDRVVNDVERFARRNPAAFLGGAVALGFLASRFLKSSSDAMYGGGDYYSSEAYGGYSGGRFDSAIGSGDFTGGATPGRGYGSGAGGYGAGSTGGTGIGGGAGSGTGLGSTGIGGSGTLVSSGTGALGGSGTGTTSGSGLGTAGRTGSTTGGTGSSTDTPSDFGSINSGTDKDRTGRK